MNCTQELDTVLVSARREAARCRQLFCECEQVLESLLVYQGHKAAAAPLKEHLEKLPRLSFELPEVELSRSVIVRALPAAAKLCRDDGVQAIGVAELTKALTGENSPIPRGLREIVLQRLNTPATVGGPNGQSKDGAGSPRPKSPNAKIEKFLRPIVAPDEGHLVTRPELLDRILLTLTFGNPVLVGPSGSGRNSLVRLLAARLLGDDCPPLLRSTRLVSLDLTALIAGTSYRGELEERVADLVAYLGTQSVRYVLVVREIRLLAGGGTSSNGTSITPALLAALQDRRFSLLGCATHDELREDLEESPGLVAALTPVHVDSASDAEARRLLSSHTDSLGQKFGVGFSEGTVGEAVSLCAHHLPHLALPGTAARLLEHAAAVLGFESAMLQQNPDRAGSSYWKIIGAQPPLSAQTPQISKRHLLHALSAQHRIPIEHLEGGATSRIRTLEQVYQTRIFGQNHVLPVLRNTVEIALRGLADSGRPRGVLFFLGPPGTGKSETAKMLAQVLMGREDAVLRFDMSEFQDRSSVSTLIGSDKGLVGSNEGGRLTEPLRANPHRVILFDEIEKADPSIFNLFLQILGYGQIHDKRGSLVSFQHALIIFTSNAGCDKWQSLADLKRQDIIARLRQIFRAEFLDRIDEFVPFQSVDAPARACVARYQLGKLGDLLLREHRVALSWDADVISSIAERPETEPGVRDILRWIQGEVKPAVAGVLLDTTPPGSNEVIRLALGESGRVVAARESDPVPDATVFVPNAGASCSAR